LSEDLPKLLETVLELRQKAKDFGDDPANNHKDVTQKDAVKGTVAAIAGQLSVKTGPDLIIAAAAKLTLVDGKDTFSRDELIAAMKTATSYYKKSDVNNLSSYLNTHFDNKRRPSHPLKSMR
jgi:endoglucanase Acf2